MNAGLLLQSVYSALGGNMSIISDQRSDRCILVKPSLSKQGKTPRKLNSFNKLCSAAGAEGRTSRVTQIFANPRVRVKGTRWIANEKILAQSQAAFHLEIGNYVPFPMDSEIKSSQCPYNETQAEHCDSRSSSLASLLTSIAGQGKTVACLIGADFMQVTVCKDRCQTLPC